MSRGLVQWGEEPARGRCADCGQPINDSTCFTLYGFFGPATPLNFHKHCLRSLAEDLQHDMNKQVFA